MGEEGRWGEGKGKVVPLNVRDALTPLCIPVLIYGLEVCPLTKSDLKSLDFPVNRFL